MIRLGLALGGGGARGGAHIAVLEKLVKLSIRPDLIVGTSIGGMIGALTAVGLPPDKIKAFLDKINVGQLYKLPIGAPALTGTTKIRKLLEETIGANLTFADLPIPLGLVTSDLMSRKAIVLDDGDLISAILATIAIPVILPPVEWGDMVLVDGGLLNNTPFDVAVGRGATFVIAVDLTKTEPYGTPMTTAVGKNLVERALAMTQRHPAGQVMMAVMDIITHQSFTAHMAVSQPDLLIRPDLGTIGLLDFNRWQEAYTAGVTAVDQQEEMFQTLKERLTKKD